MSDTDHGTGGGLRVIVVVQVIGGALAFVPLLYLAALTFKQSSFVTPQRAFQTIWIYAALMTALFNFFGGVALYYNPRRRLIVGSLILSALLLVSMLFL